VGPSFGGERDVLVSLIVGLDMKAGCDTGLIDVFVIKYVGLDSGSCDGFTRAIPYIPPQDWPDCVSRSPTLSTNQKRYDIDLVVGYLI